VYRKPDFEVMVSSYDLPLRINDSTCSDLEFAEIERWVRKRILEKLDEWKARNDAGQ
jgi:hypothetical protein